MSYTSRHRYKNRREKFKQTKRKTLVFIVFVLIAAGILLIKNWQRVTDWFIITFK